MYVFLGERMERYCKERDGNLMLNRGFVREGSIFIGLHICIFSSALSPSLLCAPPPLPAPLPLFHPSFPPPPPPPHHHLPLINIQIQDLELVLVLIFLPRSRVE